MAERTAGAMGAAASAAAGAEQKAAELERHPWMRAAARAGFVANGLVHIVMGGIALGVALGAGGSADQSGAMRAIAATPFGLVLLWAVGVALIALAAHSLVTAIAARRAGGEAKDAVKHAGKAVAYGSVAVTAITFAAGGSSDSAEQSQSATSELLATPFGVVLVVLLGAGVLGIGAFFIYRGVTRSFMEDVRPPARARRAAEVLGAIGYCAKGVALAIVGVLFAVAGFTHDASEATGIDGALKTLRELPFGQVLLAIVGAGLFAYGIYTVIRAAWSSKH